MSKLYGGEEHATSSTDATGLPWLYGLEPADPIALISKCNSCICMYDACLVSLLSVIPPLSSLFAQSAISRRSPLPAPHVSLVLFKVSDS